MLRRTVRWLFQNRETGAITVAQAPNLVLWIVIVAASLEGTWSPAGVLGATLTIIVRVGLLVWAVDEIVRGVNPWRRLLGAAVAIYEIAATVL